MDRLHESSKKTMFFNWVYWQCGGDLDEAVIQVMKLIFPKGRG